ncbi:MAG: EFR1 family ferrodoxin [Bacilli bacterium]
MKILYFTSTGNSLYIAKQFKAELLSIPQLIKENNYEIEADKIGIVTPIYYLNTPKIVEEFLIKANLKSKYIFMIFTYGGFVLDTSRHIKNYGIDFKYVNYLKMPENFIPLSDMKKSTQSQKELESLALDKINVIKEDVEREAIKVDKFYFTTILSYFINKVVMRKWNRAIKMQDNKFYVTDKCTLCKTCEKICPVSNISVVNKVEFKNNCEQCMGCIHACPHVAIHHKDEKSAERYINSNILIQDIIKSNMQ